MCEGASETSGMEDEGIPVSTPNKNAFIESWHPHQERECLTQKFASYAGAYATITRWIAYITSIALTGVGLFGLRRRCAKRDGGPQNQLISAGPPDSRISHSERAQSDVPALSPLSLRPQGRQMTGG